VTDPAGTVAPLEGAEDQEQIGRATTVITFWNLVSRATGFARVLATTAALGVAALGDTYGRTNQVSNVLFELLAGGMLFSVLVPSFVVELRHGGRAEARRLASALATRAVVVLGVLVAIGIVARRPILELLSSGASDASRDAQVEVGSFLLLFILPQLLLYLVGAVASALLQADRRFAATSFAPVLNNVVVTATMVAFAVVHDPDAGLRLTTGEKVLLGGGTLAGTAAMTAVPLVALVRARLGLRPRWRVPDADLRGLARRGLWGAGHVGLNEVLVMATVVLAAPVDGGATAYQTAFTFFLLPHALLAHPIFTALYPRLSQDGAEGRHDAFARDLAGGLRAMTFLLLPAAALLSVVALPGLGAFHVAQFSGGGARFVALVLASFLAGLIGYSTFFLLTRAAYAVERPRLPTLVNLGITVGTVSSMAVATRFLSGPALLVTFGLATSFFAVAGSAVLLHLLTVRLGRPIPVYDTVARTALASVVAGAAALAVTNLIGWDGRLTALASAAAGTVVGVATFAALARVLAIPERLVWVARIRRLAAPVRRIAGGPHRVRAVQAVLVLAVLVLLGGSLVMSRARTPRTEAGGRDLGRVVVFAVPGLAIEDLDPDVMPNLVRLADRGAIAVANVRIAAARPQTSGAYAALGAGNKTAPAGERAHVYEADTEVRPGVTIGESIAAETGEAVEGRIVVDGFASLAEELGVEGNSQAGALAEALHAGGLRIGVVASGAGGTAPDRSVDAPAALAAVDRRGSVDVGTVGPALLRTVVGADGTEQQVADPQRYAAAVRDAQRDAAVVVVDAGETLRADEAIARLEADEAGEDQDGATTTTAPAPTSAAAGGTGVGRGPVTTGAEPAAEVDATEPGAVRRAALQRTDEVLAAIRQALAPDTLLLVAGVTPPGPGWALTPVVAQGRGIPHGYLDSGSTHRPALVTLSDLAPTILDTVGRPVPADMIGRPLRYRVADSSWTEARRLDDLLAGRQSADSVMTGIFIGVNVALYGGLLLAGAARRRLGARGRAVARFVALTCAAWPVSTYLARIGTDLYRMGTVSIVASWAFALGIAALATRLRGHRLDPILAVCGLTIAVVVADLATGAHLQVGSYLGYMPHTAPRFVGLGNSGFAVLAGATAIAMAALVARARDRLVGWWWAAGLAVIVVVADGAPWMGTDVGGIIALVPVLGLMLWVLRGNRLRWQTVVLAGLAAAAVLAVAVGLDAARPPDDRTHLGRFFLETDDGSVADTLRRKWDTNTADLRANPLAWTAPLLALAGVVAASRSERLRRTLPAGSTARVGVVGALAVGVLGWLANDSGVVVLALACVPIGPVLVLLSERTRTDDPAPPVPGSAPVDGSPPATVTPDMAEPSVPSPELSVQHGSSDEPTDRREATAAPAPGTRPPDGPVVAIVPAKDRADSVAATVAALSALDLVDRVLVVDDGSTDDTATVAAAAGAEVLRLPHNRGKGGAVLAGAAAAADAGVYLLIDADLAGTAAAADALLLPVLDGRADLTVGVLPSAGKKGGFGTIRRLSAAGIRRACGLTVAAPLSGQRAIRGPLLRGLGDAERFGLEVAMTIDVARGGGRVLEVPVPMDHRHTGRTASGFAHRGRQGVDIARALLPRLLGRAGLAALLAVAVAAWAGGTYLFSASRSTDGTSRRGTAAKVVLVGVSDLRLDDLDPAVMPNLAALSERGTYGLVSPRTGGGRSVPNAWATIGAGSRATSTAPLAVVQADDGERGRAAEAVLRRAFGDEVTGAILVPEVPQLERATVEGTGRTGALADALHAAGRRTALVGNASGIEAAGGALGEVLGDDAFADLGVAPAASAVVDRHGVIDAGNIGDDLLRPAPERPFGVATDLDRFADAVGDAVTAADLVVVEPGDLIRAAAYAPYAPGTAGEQRQQALADLDQLLGRITVPLGDDVLVIVVGLTGSDPLAPLVLAGGGWQGGGFASPSTRHAHLATFSDLTPTVLEALGIDHPRSMVGKPLRWHDEAPARSDLDREQQLIRTRDHGYSNIVDLLVLGSLVLLGATATVAVARRRAPGSRLARAPAGWLGVAVLALATVPAATFVVRGIGPLYRPGPGSVVAVVAVAVVVALTASRRSAHPLGPLTAVSALTWLLLTVDLSVGAPLQASSFLGYTPSVAARFAGIGNAGFAVYAAAATVVVAGLLRRPRHRAALPLAVAVAVVTIVADGAPWLGADVGGILTLVPTFGVVLWWSTGRRPTWRSATAVLLATVAVLAVAVGLEALRPDAGRTHIGRFFLGGDGVGSLDTVRRKWDVNVALLRNSDWATLTWIGVAFAALTLVVADGWRRAYGVGRARIGLVGLGLVAVLGWATNDSGPVVSGLVAVTIAAHVAALVLAEPDEPRWVEPEPGARPQPEARP